MTLLLIIGWFATIALSYYAANRVLSKINLS